ncbi:MAG: P-type DNA transfer ATPase VirB11 [Alphaproteobacteria bacterium]
MTQISKHTALDTYLSPLKDFFAQPKVSEISINQPGEIWVEIGGDMVRHELPELDLTHLKALGRLVAQASEQKISEETPLLSATLPEGFRIQVVFPPACEPSKVAISIRKQTILDFDLDQYEALGAFQNTIVKKEENLVDKRLRELLDAGAVKDFFKEAILAKKNIIISGGTSTGKTTFFNAALKVIPPTERIITCEDAREINIPHIPNKVHLVASKGGQGRALVTMQDLIEACLRLRPDRLMLGELRGKEAFSFMRAVNTGHPGSISTLHADTPQLAIEQLILMIMQAGLGITREQIKNYVENVINVVIQLKRGAHGMRYVSEIYFRESL